MASPTPNDKSKAPPFPKIAEHYQVQKKLGEGAFGEVYLAKHDLLGQEFAIKVLKPELCEDESLRQRFLDEARALIRFSHPNVVQMRHVGETEGRLYLVMDFVSGKPLEDLIRKEGPFEEGRAANLMLQILAGLEAAHAAGIIHRDLKPTNILVEKRADGREHLRILDFGLSKLSGVDSHRSVSGTVVGTLAYMSPEQLQGEKNLDGRSDVFAAGLIFMEMLQGHHPYPGESGIVVAAKLLRDPVPPLDSKKASRISNPTKAALSQALERDRDARFPSAVAFAQALMGKGPPSDTSKITTIQEAKAELARQDAAKAARDGERKAKARKTGILVGAVAVAALGAGAFFLLGRGGEPKPEEPAPMARGPEAPRTPVAPGPETPRTPVVPEPETPRTPGVPPAEPTPTPAEPTPTKPPPTPPEPTPPEPTPTPPEPSPTPPGPGPAPAEPTATPPEPTPTPPGPTPAPAEPTPTPPTPAEPTPPTPAPTMSPAEMLKQADALDAAGRHVEARALFLGALEKNAWDERALRGVGNTHLEEADTLARRGETAAALAALDKALAWWKERYAWHEKQSVSADPEDGRIASGLARTYLAEIQTERARWLALSGDAAGAATARQQATDHFRFANQFLNRDSVRYWEMLIRRARLATLEGRLDAAVEDLAITTATNNVEVPAHMWVAHGVGLRRLAEAALTKNDRPGAKKHALASLDVVKRGQAWQRAKFTREHYLEAARVLYVNGLVAEGAAERVPLLALLQYYVTEAGKHPAPGAEAPERTEARMASARAAQAIVEGLTLNDQGKAAESKAAFEKAAAEAQAAVQADQAAAEKSGLLPASFPFRVLAMARFYLGDAAGAQQATQAGNAAGSKNPE